MTTINNNEDDNAETTTRTATTRTAQVVIIGAGASGLMCAYTLLKKKKKSIVACKEEEIVILEARDRVGGRIHTTIEEVATSSSPSSDKESTPNCLYRDHGAAWVHGTGFDWPNYISSCTRENDDQDDDDAEEDTPTSISNNNNPMMELLQQITPQGENVCLTHLEPIFKLGNPWTRPGHVLIGPKNLILFVDGKKIGRGGEREQERDDDVFLLRKALTHHNNIMSQVGRIGHNLIVNGKTNDTVEQSLRHALDKVLLEQDAAKRNNNNNIQENERVLIPKIAAFYRHLIECWHATSASGLQLYEFSAHQDDDDDDDDDDHVGDDNEEEWEDEGDYYGPHCTMKKGMQTVLEPLLETVSSCIRLNQEVCSVTCTTGQQIVGDDNNNNNNNNNSSSTSTIRVECSSGMIVDADYCVVTVSLGCLAHSLSGRRRRSSGDSKETGEDDDKEEEEGETTTRGTISFTPDLSSAKVDAIQRMCMGTYKKVYLSFDRIFWPRKEPFVGLIRSSKEDQPHHQTDDGLGNYMLLDNLWARKDVPCVEAVLIGDAGKWATNKPNDIVCNAVVKFMADAMGLELESQLKRWLVHCHITRWEEDKYSRGAYSGYRLGTLEEHTKGLAASEWGGHLVFAGEATLSGYEGSVHAALISGVNIANEIVEKLN